MSAPLKLTANDLRNLADALDKLTAVYTQHGVIPGAYGPGLGLRTEGGDDVNLDLELVEGQLMIHDTYGS